MEPLKCKKTQRLIWDLMTNNYFFSAWRVFFKSFSTSLFSFWLLDVHHITNHECLQDPQSSCQSDSSHWDANIWINSGFLGSGCLRKVLYVCSFEHRLHFSAEFIFVNVHDLVDLSQVDLIYMLSSCWSSSMFYILIYL